MSLIKTFKTLRDQSQRGPQALPSQPIQDSAASFLVTASMATVHWPALQGNRISGKTETFNNSTCQYRSERNGCTCTNLLNKPTNRMSDPSEWPEQCSVCPPGKPHITSLVSKKIYTIDTCLSNPSLCLDFFLQHLFTFPGGSFKRLATWLLIFSQI